MQDNEISVFVLNITLTLTFDLKSIEVIYLLWPINLPSLRMLGQTTFLTWSTSTKIGFKQNLSLHNMTISKLTRAIILLYIGWLGQLWCAIPLSIYIILQIFNNMGPYSTIIRSQMCSQHWNTLCLWLLRKNWDSYPH